jgi:ketosteroid isomerase-like protein
MKSTEYENRLKRLEDIQEIKDLHREYMFEVNNREWDRVIDCFSDDCSANIGKWGLRKGKESLQKLFKVDIAGNNKGKGRDGHFAIQPVIKVDGDKAEGHWLMYVMISDQETGNAKKWSHGRHDVKYARVNGEWKIQTIVFTSPWPREADSFPILEED